MLCGMNIVDIQYCWYSVSTPVSVLSHKFAHYSQLFVWFICWPLPKQKHLDIWINIYPEASSITHNNDILIVLVSAGGVMYKSLSSVSVQHQQVMVAMHNGGCTIKTSGSCSELSRITEIVKSLHWQHWQQIVNSNQTQWTNTFWKSWFVIKNSVWVVSLVNIVSFSCRC